MINFKNLGRGVALASSTLALGSALAISSSISSAQAATLGSINITGEANISNLTDESPENDSISFNGPFTTVSSSGELSGLTANSISTINLDSPGTGVEVSGTTLTSYSATFSNPFISFNDGSTFVVDNPTSASRNFTTSADENLVGYTFPELRGSIFNNNRELISEGVLTANQISGTGVNGSFSFTLSAVNVGVGPDIPEPATTGALVALGIGAFFTNNLAKKSKVKIKA
ncbi:hypothetical protein [Anabaena azotica]|uniref:PEP-CTERM sorting domain-containing protein n=1 Tax=Anabaena azotica FACHB-119 TaxID=947527 RepID=A0ABR8D3F9_9NOST|nr:hypothetical protein [Anabaena azotica]MBD2500288.1 hypothetical protein [Anabaena azotica FACHB-119]